jgi:phospholipid/cholesterol/gamma-HCH transport system substrate-binding protein
MAGYARGRDTMVVAAFAVIAAIAFTLLFMYMTNRALSLSQSDLYVQIPSAEGLRKGDPVFFRGVDVGKVKKLIFQQDGSVLLKVRITERIPLTVDGRAALVALDLFGRQSVVLREGTANAPRLLSGDTLAGAADASMTDLIADLGQNAREMTGPATMALLHSALDGLGESTRSMARLGDEMRALVHAQQANITALTTGTAAITENLRIITEPDAILRMRDQAEHTSHSLAIAAARMDTTMASLSSLLAALEKGEGSAGMMLHDPALYQRTEALLLGLEALVVDLKANPRRYINLKIF